MNYEIEQVCISYEEEIVNEVFEGFEKEEAAIEMVNKIKNQLSNE